MGSVKVSILNIPPELRLKIYRYCFILEIVTLKHPIDETMYMPFIDFSEEGKSSNGTTNRRAKSKKAFDEHQTRIKGYKKRNATSAQLLRTCKLCLGEGLPVLYGENELNFSSLSGLKHYLRLWGNDVKALIKTLVVMEQGYGFRGSSPIAQHLNVMTSIRRLDFHYQYKCFLQAEMTLKLDSFLGQGYWIKRSLPCNTFLKKLFSKNPSIQSGVIMDIAKIEGAYGFSVVI
jgi:hypothetical protein